MFSSCDFCLASSESGVVLIILPCGYTICLNHFDQLESSFECLVCKNHKIKKDDCFNMNKNRSILKKLEYNEKVFELQKRLDSFLYLKNSPKPCAKQNFNILIDTILNQKELLKTEISKQIDSYADKLIDDVIKTKSQYESKMITCLDSIDFDQLNQLAVNSAKRFRAENELKYLEEKIELLDQKNNLLDIKINEFTEYFAEFSTFRLIKSNNYKFDVESIFGRLELESNIEAINDKKNETNYNDHFPQVPNLNELMHSATLAAKSVWCIDQLSTGEIITGSDDKSIKIFDLKNGQMIRELLGHKSLILDLKVDNNDIIYSSSNDGTIKVWNKTGECIKTIVNMKPVNCIELWDGKLISGDENGEIIIWNKETGTQIKKIKAHTYPIFCLKFFDTNRLLTGSSDNKIKFWNLETGVCIKEFIGHQAQVLVLEKLNDYEFLSGSDDETCRVWNIKYKNNVLTLKQNFKCVPSFVALQNSNFLSCSTDGFVRLWDRNLRKWTSKFNRQKDVQHIKLLKTGELICCIENGYVTVWK